MKIDIGDRVKINGYEGTIIELHKDKQSVIVKFDDTNLIPPIMKVLIKYLEGRMMVDKCPKCGNAYHETKSPVRDVLWKDCRKCGKTKEELELELFDLTTSGLLFSADTAAGRIQQFIMYANYLEGTKPGWGEEATDWADVVRSCKEKL